MSFAIALPKGWAQRIDSGKFVSLVERMSRERKAASLPGDPGEGPDLFDVPIEVNEDLLDLLNGLYGQRPEIVLRQVAAASLNKALTKQSALAHVGEALKGPLGILAAILLPIIAAVLFVWVVSRFAGGDAKDGPGFVER